MKSKLLVCHVEDRRIFWLRHYLNRLVPKLKRSGVIPGWPRLCAFPNDLIGREMSVAGLYEMAGLQAVKKLVAMDVVPNAGEAVFIDVGANIGIYTTSLATVFKTVLAFEPHPLTHRLLAMNVDLNEISNVTSFQYALSDRDGRAALIDAGADNVGASSLEKDRGDTSKPGPRTVHEVELRQGDHLLLEERCIGPVAFIKIDVEGHEAAVINGMSGLIARDMPVIAFEANSREQSEGVRQTLEGMGYSAFYGLDFHPCIGPLPLRVLLLTMIGVSHVLRPLSGAISHRSFALVFALTETQARQLVTSA